MPPAKQVAFPRLKTHKRFISVVFTLLNYVSLIKKMYCYLQKNGYNENVSSVNN